MYKLSIVTKRESNPQFGSIMDGRGDSEVGRDYEGLPGVDVEFASVVAIWVSSVPAVIGVFWGRSDDDGVVKRTSVFIPSLRSLGGSMLHGVICGITVWNVGPLQEEQTH